MVIEDYFHPGRPKKPVEKQPQNRRPQRRMRMGSPYDRLGAAVIDIFVILLPLLLLFVSPLRRLSLESRFVNDQSMTVAVHAGMTLVAVITIIAYQTFLTWLVGATVGKLFFGLRVVNLWNGKKPNLTGSLLRSLVWVIDSTLLFIPHLSIFSNKKRRPPHDRMADTVVITLRGRGVTSPGVVEGSFVRGVFAALITAATIIIAINIVQFFKGLKSEDQVFSFLEQTGKLCTAVGEAQQDWNSKDGDSPPERLSVAMSLFSAGLVSKTCLALEVDDSLNRQGKETPMAYLAQAFVHSDRPEVSDAYLKKVCELDASSHSCTMSHIVDNWSKGDWEGVRTQLSGLNSSAPTFIWIWGLRHMVKHGNYVHVIKTIEEQIWPQKPLSPFLTMQRAKAYWYLDRKSEARAIASVGLETFDYTDRLDLASWLCEEEVEDGCEGGRGFSCEVFRNSLNETPGLLVDAQVSLTYIKERECSEGTRLDYGKLQEQMRLEEASSFVQALEFYQGQKREESRNILESLARAENASHQFQVEARRRLIDWAKTPEELAEIHDEWEQQDSNLDWIKVGRSLFESYFRMGAYGPSYSVGQRLQEYDLKDDSFERAMVISAYHLGQREAAWKLLSSYLSKGESLEPGRKPANQDALSVIYRVLKEEFESQ